MSLIHCGYWLTAWESRQDPAECGVSKERGVIIPRREKPKNTQHTVIESEYTVGIGNIIILCITAVRILEQAGKEL